jgi:hypothetical protein
MIWIPSAAVAGGAEAPYSFFFNSKPGSVNTSSTKYQNLKSLLSECIGAAQQLSLLVLSFAASMATLDQLKASLDAVNELLQGDPTDDTLLGMQRDCLQAIAAFEEVPVSYYVLYCAQLKAFTF